MSIPQDLFYAKTHEWVSFEDGVATVGITDFAKASFRISPLWNCQKLVPSLEPAMKPQWWNR
jgi:hypothetical protein